MNEEQTQNAVTKETKTTRLNVTDIEWLQSAAGEGESPAATLSRMREELVLLRGRCDGYEAEVMAVRAENDVLLDGLKDFEGLRSRTAVAAPGQTAIGDFGGELVKDTMDALTDVCDDEAVCVRTALHLIDKKADLVSRQLDRDHSRTEKEKDRDHIKEEKEKDRKLKQDLETSKAEHQKNLTLIKKGIVKQEDLKGVVFLGSMEKRKTTGELLAEKKKQAYHAANNDDYDFDEPGDGCVVDGEELGDAEHEDPDHV